MTNTRSVVWLGMIACGLSMGQSARADGTGTGLDAGSCTTDQKVSQVVTQHTTTIAGKQFDYTATAGFIEVTSDDGTAKACIFSTSYVVQQPAGSAPRPITFAFNGGPGSASLWLHMGMLGPKRVDMGPDGLQTPTSLDPITNDYSALDLTDLVLIDPTATGFSHVEGDASDAEFFGVKNDYLSIEAFIRDYLNANDRWDSPKYVLGESYGGFRGSLLAEHLQTDMSIGVDGLILVSPCLSTATISFGESDNDLPYITYLPTYATTAWYHQKIDPAYQSMDVGQVYSLAKYYADNNYRNALDAGNEETSAADYQVTTQALSEMVGLPVAQIQDLGLRVPDDYFFANLLGDQNKELGRYDSRFVGARLLGQTGDEASDPSYTSVEFAFTAAINQYLRSDLNFMTTSPYETMADVSPWPFDSDGEPFSVEGDLSQAFEDNPNLRLFIASGYYDFACPMGTVEYSLSRLDPSVNQAKSVTLKRYAAGHMVYINPVSLAQLKTDLSAFIH